MSSFFHHDVLKRGGFALSTLCSILLAPLPSAAAGGEQLWRFYDDFGAVTLVVPIDDLSGNGGKDVLVGSEDDALYLVEGKGTGGGKQLWQTPAASATPSLSAFQATVSAAAAVGDIDGDGKSDIVGGDQSGYLLALSGASGNVIWRYSTVGTVMSLISIPDIDGDNRPEAVFGSESDTVFCMSSKARGGGQVIWKFGVPGSSGHPGPPAGGHAKLAVGGRPVTVPSGANSVALLHDGSSAFGLAVGTNNDTVYCLPTAGGAPKWKTGLPGDVWKVVAFPDQNGDGVEELLLACGADAGYMLSGKDGKIMWSHAVSLGAVSVAVSPDVTGDGKPDALIGDGGGHVHCVAGNAANNGSSVPAAWTFDFGDTSTILSIAALGDVDGDDKSECIVGTSNDVAAIVTGMGVKGWSVTMGGDVNGVANLGDIDGNGKVDAVAGAETGYASALSGAGPVVGVAPRTQPAGARLARLEGLRGGVTWEIRLDRPARVSLEVFDGSGRRVGTPFSVFMPAGLRRVAWDGVRAQGRYSARLIVDGKTAAADFAK